MKHDFSHEQYSGYHSKCKITDLEIELINMNSIERAIYEAESEKEDGRDLLDARAVLIQLRRKYFSINHRGMKPDKD
ncbi:hypothetical protein C818_04263 [Lachnospiraceae bacterium MD308]|nr:hypothetical protein C818_04263 [Lachnospiraceae bacterium MD308]